MRVRLANLKDMSDILAYGKDSIRGTNYEGLPLEFNSVIARRTLKASMLDCDSRVWITEHDGKICGLLIGQLGPMPMFAAMAATDLIFSATKGGDLLIDAFIEWCQLRKAARIDMGFSAGEGRDRAVARMMRRKGFAYSGGVYHLNLLGAAP